MIDLSRPWPFGIGTRSWWLAAAACVVALGAALSVDAPLSVWAQGWPSAVIDVMALVTNLGLSDWILYPTAILYLVTAGLALAVRWPLMRAMLWQFAGLYGFVFLGVGVPSLASTLLKSLIGRARPMHLLDAGVFSLRPNFLDWTYQGFPSGHATTIFALAAVTAFFSARLVYPALAVAILVGISRVALGVHYPSDVVGGAIVGVLGAYAVRRVFARRGWVFVSDHAGRIHARPMSAIRRYVSLKRRGSAPAPRTGRP